MINWSEYNRFHKINEKYLPDIGEGDTMATQLVTAINRLVYKYYNDGDVYDNTGYLDGWWNDVSDCANWIYQNIGPEIVGIQEVMEQVWKADEEDYEEILFQLASDTLTEDYLEGLNKREQTGSIYDCPGIFHFECHEDDDDDFY